MGAEPISHECFGGPRCFGGRKSFGGPRSPRRFLQEFQSRFRVPTLSQAFEHFTFVADDPPEVIACTVDSQGLLVPGLPPTSRHDALSPAFADFRSQQRPEPMPPVPDRLVADVDPSRAPPRSSAFRRDGGNRRYIITAMHVISVLVLKPRNGERWVMGEGQRRTQPAETWVPLAAPANCHTESELSPALLLAAH